MHKLIRSISGHYSLFLFFAVCIVLMLTVLTSFYFSTPLSGISISDAERLDTGWMYEDGGELSPIESLPCRLNVDALTLKLSRELSDLSQEANHVLAFRTRYESIRVWADETLVYEAAQGKEHALGSMWHFVSLRDCIGASRIYVELTRYDASAHWDLSTVFLDHSHAILMYLLYQALPAILFWLFTMLFTLLLVFVALFMAGQKISGVSSMLALAAFIFLSGQWILLDSKITTIFGGNYALTYFLSYAAFYLLTAPYLLYIQLMLDSRSRVIRYLTWIFVGNAGVCMALHLFQVVSIRDTAFTVHILIFLSLLVLAKEFWYSVVKQKERKLFCTFLGTVFIYAAGLISIVLYYIGKLPPANSTTLYSWALLIMIFCATTDAILSLSRFWKQKQYMDHYRRLAIKDSMTMMGNRNAYEMRLQDLSAAPPARLIFILFDVDNLKFINDTYGHHIGDQAIYTAAQCIREVFEPIGACYRIGGDEFVVILTNAVDLDMLLQKYDFLLAQQNKNIVPFSVSYGWAEKNLNSSGRVSLEEIISLQKTADVNLYYRKKEKHKSTK